MLVITSIYLLGVNIVTLLTFWLDKRRAGTVELRISERRLLTLSAIGGTPAAYVARAVFRHKTRKQPFSNRLHIIAALQILYVVGHMLWIMRLTSS